MYTCQKLPTDFNDTEGQSKGYSLHLFKGLMVDFGVLSGPLYTSSQSHFLIRLCDICIQN